MANISDFLLVSDLDQTLLNSEHKLSDANRQAINDYLKRGGQFTIATGRGLASLKLLEIPTSHPMITHNGGAIYDFKEKKLLWHRAMERENSKTIIKDVLKEFPGVGVEWVTTEKYYIVSTNEEVKWHLDFELLHREYPDSVDSISEDCIKILFLWDEGRIAEVDKYLKKRIGEGMPFSFSYSFSTIMEFMSKDSNKGVALAAFCELFKIPIEKTIAVGDNINDIEFLKRAGYAIAVENALDEVKEVADLIVTNNNNNAIADVIGRILKGEISV